MPRRFAARFAETAADTRAAQALRGQAFRGGLSDADAFDQFCTHVLVEDHLENRVACAFRIQPFASGRVIADSYAAQFYELAGLKQYQGKLVEIGRFCIDPHYNDPDILRAAWGVLTTYVDENNVKMLFGCSSFEGTASTAHLEAFALLNERHLAPHQWLPKIKAPHVLRFSDSGKRPNQAAAQRAMPPLLRSYLAMGGWVSDHAVVDADLDTLHVFTGLEIAAIPEGRKRLLRAVAG